MITRSEEIRRFRAGAIVKMTKIEKFKSEIPEASKRAVRKARKGKVKK